MLKNRETVIFMNFRKILITCFLFIGIFTFSQDQKINQFDQKGNRHGLWRGVFETTQRPRYEGVFVNGKETGVFKYFDDTKAGTVIATRDFSKGDGSAYVTFFDQKGNKVSEGPVNKNRENEGEWKYYHKESAQLMSVETFKNGKLNGKSIVFYTDGKIASETNYVEGVKEGVFKKYSKEGVVLEEIPYKNNQFSGLVTYRDIKGNLLAQGHYEKGLKKGIWKYYENGKLVKEEDTEAKKTIRKVN